MSEQHPGTSLTIPIEKLAVMNWLGEVGVDGVEKRLRRLPVDEISVRSEQVKSGYTGDESVDAQFGSHVRVGVKVRIPNTPAGHMLVLFSPESANNAAALMLENAVEDVSAASFEMARDALTELSNMIASGFVDEWADLFDRHIVTAAPNFVQNPERELIRRVVTGDDDLGLYITSSLRIPEYDIDASILLFPEEETFVNAASKLSLSVIKT
jgi:chemotaxis protein CheC